MNEFEKKEVFQEFEICETEFEKEIDELEAKLIKNINVNFFNDLHQYRTVDEILRLPKYSNMIYVFIQIKHRVS